MRAQLRNGTVVDLTKECGCLDSIHTGAHWLHFDDLYIQSNQRLRDAGNLQGFASEEAARLRIKIWEMKIRGIVELLP